MKNENFTADVTVNKEKLIKFWQSSASESESRNLSKDSSSMQVREFFHNLAHISGEKTDQIPHENFTTNVTLDKEVPLNFGNYSYPDSKYGLRIWTRFALAEVCALRVRAGANHPEPPDRGRTGVKGHHDGTKRPHMVVRESYYVGVKEEW